MGKWRRAFPRIISSDVLVSAETVMRHAMTRTSTVTVLFFLGPSHHHNLQLLFWGFRVQGLGVRGFGVFGFRVVDNSMYIYITYNFYKGDSEN